MRTDDDLSSYVGARLIGGELRPAPDGQSSLEDSVEGWSQVQFLVISTSKGDCVMSSHNEHNGWYSGFEIAVRALESPAPLVRP